jgi:hypothetical protein
MTRKTRNEMVQIEAEVIEYVKRNGPISAYRVALGLHLADSTTRQILNNMVGDGTMDAVETYKRKAYSYPGRQ